MGFVGKSEKPSAVFYCHGVGEIRTAMPLLKALHGKTGSLRTVLMVYGRDAFSLMNRATPPHVDSVVYCPYYDEVPAARELARLRAVCLLFVESDLSPVYVKAAKKIGASVAALNFSLSHWRDKDLHGLSQREFAAMIEGLDLVTFKHESVRKAFFGAREIPEHLKITGNFRYAVTGDVPHLEDRHLASLLEDARRRAFVLVAGSTYAIEEEMLLGALKDCIGGRKLVLIIAPRKPWKASLALRRARAFGFDVAMRSEAKSLSCLPQVVVVDTMGELPSLYGFGHAAFVGGTIRDKGGHNIFEPARFGMPVIFGPHCSNNFDFARELLEVGGGHCVQTKEDVGRHVSRWINDASAREKEGLAAKEAFAQGAHILQQTVHAVEELLDKAAVRR